MGIPLGVQLKVPVTIPDVFFTTLVFQNLAPTANSLVIVSGGHRQIY